MTVSPDARESAQDLEDAENAAAVITDLRSQLASLRTAVADLELQYLAEADDLVGRAKRDADDIARMRKEADRLVVLLRGGSLFGRYAADAEHHARTANVWRWIAVLVLLVTTAVGVMLPLLDESTSWRETLAPALPLLALFTYASIESNNHRRRELDRRRIYLRMAAVESYIGDAKDAESRVLLDDFIRKHFIDRDLDDNEINSVSVRGLGPVTLVIGRRDRSAASQPATENDKL